MTSNSGKAVYGATNPTPEQVAASGVRRMGSVFALDPAGEQLYRDLHANAWPSIVERLRLSNIRNFSIFITELAGQKYVVSYYEYVGSDFEADQQVMADDPETQRWWQALSPCDMPGVECGEMDPVFLME
ncbi:MAG: L-rhamnose mutarotase [Planctomycetota bacterium]|jgi:L-rhamnose mutarotase